MGVQLSGQSAAVRPFLKQWTNNPFPRVWAPLIDGAASREAALGAYEAATLMMLKRSLRNGSASTRQSSSHVPRMTCWYQPHCGKGSASD